MTIHFCRGLFYGGLLTLDTDTTPYAKTVNLKYENFKQKKLKLNMSVANLARTVGLSSGLLESLNRNYQAEDGTDCRNYGGLGEYQKPAVFLPNYWKSNRTRLLSM